MGYLQVRRMMRVKYPSVVLRTHNSSRSNTGTPQNQQDIRSPFSFRSRIKPVKLSIGPNVNVQILDGKTFSLIQNDSSTEMRFRCDSLEDRTQWVRSIRIASRRRQEDQQQTQRSVREETEYLLTQLQCDMDDFDAITRDITRKHREQERIVEHALSVFNELRLSSVPDVQWDMPMIGHD